jgi:hypothetical protein
MIRTTRERGQSLMPIPPEALRRYGQLQTLARMARATADGFGAPYSDAREELDRAITELERNARGVPGKRVEVDADGNAVLVSQRVSSQPVDRGGHRLRDFEFFDQRERAPAFDVYTRRIHEARQAVDRAQRERREALERSAVLRRLEDEAREALEARGLRPDPRRGGIDVVVVR